MFINWQQISDVLNWTIEDWHYFDLKFSHMLTTYLSEVTQFMNDISFIVITTEKQVMQSEIWLKHLQSQLKCIIIDTAAVTYCVSCVEKVIQILFECFFTVKSVHLCSTNVLAFNLTSYSFVYFDFFFTLFSASADWSVSLFKSVTHFTCSSVWLTIINVNDAASVITLQ